MGGRGAIGRGGKGGRGGGCGRMLHTKSSVGKHRDSIKGSVSKSLKGKEWVKTVEMEDRKKISIIISIHKDGIKHISNDILKFGVVEEKDIGKLYGQLKNATFVKHSGLKHQRKDNMDHFYYFKAQGKNIYFNVGRKTVPNGKVYYELYSITSKI